MKPSQGKLMLCRLVRTSHKFFCHLSIPSTLITNTATIYESEIMVCLAAELEKLGIIRERERERGTRSEHEHDSYVSLNNCQAPPPFSNMKVDPRIERTGTQRRNLVCEFLPSPSCHDSYL